MKVEEISPPLRADINMLTSENAKLKQSACYVRSHPQTITSRRHRFYVQFYVEAFLAFLAILTSVLLHTSNWAGEYRHSRVLP